MQSTHLSFDKVDITGGFYSDKQRLIRDVTIQSVYDRFYETGRITAFEMNWKEGEPNKPHYFWDSDVAKWIESAAYLLEKKRDSKLEAEIDRLVDLIEKNRMDDGYFNIYYQLFCPDQRFISRGNHELYCAGHLLEAAIAYDHATGKGKFLSLMKDYMCLIEKMFKVEKAAAFTTPGHEELELALVKLYDYTKERRWLELSEFFINMRGIKEKKKGEYLHAGIYSQDHLPVREQFTAEGHAVRACYLFCGAADVAKRLNDDGLENAMKRVFDNITQRRMYLTGGIGSTCNGEAFEGDFVLPLDTAYAETCAAIALALFARRMSELEVDSKYADVVEKVIYNSLLSGLSLDGKAFFYENAQEISLSQRKLHKALGKDTHFPITQRLKVFDCSCCPPNITRFVASIGDFLYNVGNDTVFVNQYMQSVADLGNAKIEQITDYPYDGNITLKIDGKISDLALRIPAWHKGYSVYKNGEKLSVETEKGFFHIEDVENCEIKLELEIVPKFNFADERNEFCKGKTAITYGPFVMCAEGIDNGGNLDNVIVTDCSFRVEKGDVFGKVNVLLPAEKEGKPFELRLVPYYTFANRGETDMKTWFDQSF